LVLAGCGTAGAQVSYPNAPAPNTLSVTGIGKISLAPDVAYVTVGVHTQSSEVSTAVAANSTAVDRVMSALAEAGIAREDMQTSNFSVYTMDEYDEFGQRTGALSYTVDNNVNVTVRDLTNMGALLDTAVNAGANSIWGIQFDLEDKSSAQTEARTLAVEEAKAVAADLAQVTGVSLGDLVSVSFTPQDYYYPVYGLGGGGGADAATTSIVPGLITVNVQVYLTYAID
jgi:hypothetical protein